MSDRKRLPKKISDKDIELIKISLKNNDDKLNELLVLYKENKDHLMYWHREWTELLFNSIAEIKNYLNKYRLTCYCLYASGKMIGCIEIGKLSYDEEKLKFRIIDFWIDKQYTRRGIMYNSLKLIERSLLDQGVDFIKTDIDVNNKASISLMEKLGYKLFCISYQISMDGKTMCHFGSFKKTLKKYE
jgi:RimJ/RimL family protein N-acetyltransferase